MEWVAAGVALVVGLLIGFIFERMRLGPAYRNKEQLLHEAKVEADNLRKSSELEIKEELLRRKENLNKELAKDREELRDVERKLDKRDAGLSELDNQIKAKEKMLQTTQNRLSEKT